MPHSAKHVQRLLRELQPHLPEDAERVLERATYWDPGFCDLFLDHTENTTFDDPQTGLKLALVGPRLARAVPEGTSPADRLEHRERIVRSYALLGGAFRALSRFPEAERAYGAAYRLCQGRASAACKASLDMRFAFLRACQDRTAEALDLVEQAESAFKTLSDETGAGTAAVVHGAILLRAKEYARSAKVLMQAFSVYRLDARSEFSATHNLAYAVSQADDPAEFKKAIEHLRKAQRLLGRRRSVQKCLLYWVEAKIMIRLGKFDQGEQRYRKALAGLIQFGVPYSIALVSLDLSALLRFARRWPELEELAADTYRRFREVGEDEEALAALKLWFDAVQARSLSEELIAEVKGTVEGRMSRPSGK